MFVSIRFLAATLFFLPFAYKELKQYDKQKLRDGLVLGFLFFVSFQLQTLGLKYTSASKSAFITGTFVVFTSFFQIIIERRLPTKANIVSVILVIAGVFLIAGKDSSPKNLISDLSSNFNFGDFLTLFCAIGYGIYMVVLDVATKKYDYKYLTFMQIAFTSVAATLLTPLFHFTQIEPVKIILSKDLVLAFLYTGVLTTIVATVVQTKYQKFVSPVRAGIIFSMEPIFAMIFAAIFLAESVTILGITGAIIVISGLLITEFFK